jgi:HlyD family secretion protein
MFGQQKPSLYRKESLERLSSPEQLDQMTQIIGPKTWIPLATLGTLIGIAVLWGIFGRIPITVSGQGVLVHPRKVVQLQSPATSGQLMTLTIQEGSAVKQGDVIGTIDQPDLQKQLQQQRTKLAELQAQAQDSKVLQAQRSLQEKRTIQQQRLTVQQQILDARALTPVLQDKGLASIGKQRESLQQRLNTLANTIPGLKQRMDSRQQLLRDQVITDDVFLQAQQQYLDSVAQVKDLEAQLKELDTRETDTRRSYLQNLSSISSLEGQLQELDSREKALDQQDFESSANRQNQIKEVQRAIAQLTLQLENQTKIVSPYSGRVLEIAVSPGQLLGAGTKIGAIAAEDPNTPLVAITYFPVADGKKIRPDMEIQVTPQTVKRERFGGIVGKVSTVSAFPVTQEGTINLLGNAELAKGLSASGPQMEVAAQLEANAENPSGFTWSSSKGPQLVMTSGTTTTARVVVEERAPITFVFPILRSFTGIY